MNKKSYQLIAIICIGLLIISSCNQQKKQIEKKEIKENSNSKISTDKVSPQITLEKLEGSPAYSDASLILDTADTIKMVEAKEMDFSFNIENYELGVQTAGPNAQKLANSGKGQHIHFILNNQPYSAHYESSFKKHVPDGIHHLVAFLSRSFHESVKNENSVVVRKLVIGNKPIDSLKLDMEAPTLIYSRPKGTYAGKDREEILLDFFVLNTKLSENGHKVKAIINGEEFIITEWVPHVIKGLPVGEISITLQLLDEKGMVTPGPFNKVVRSITLKK